MLYIYKFTNKINGKVYVGQTNNIENRKRNHKSEAFNKKSNGYSLPFHRAIRKYGWENFNFEVVEELPDKIGREYLNEREICFIKYFRSLTTENGYNIAKGGEGCARPQLSFEEQVELSKFFNVKQVMEIQRLLLDGYEYFEIKKKYPQLTNSFLSNINNGLNFKRQDLNYPLSTTHTKFSKQTKLEILDEIKSGKNYKEISKKYGISNRYISMINSGKKWHNDELTYPLCKKGCSQGAWCHSAKYDLIFSDSSHSKIGIKYNKAKSTITAINTGRNRKDKRFIYPLDKHKKQNQKIWNTLF